MYIAPEAAFLQIRSPKFALAKLENMPITKHFTWGEVFRHRTFAEVMGATRPVFAQALEQAHRMERVRDTLRQSLNVNAVIRVTSWYRSPAGNRAVQACLMGFKTELAFFLEVTGGAWTHVDGRQHDASYFAFTPTGKILTAQEETVFRQKYLPPAPLMTNE